MPLTILDAAFDMDTELEKNAISYAEGYSEVGYDDDQIGSVRDAFIDGAKWQRKRVWHKPDEEPEEGVEILFAWASASRLKMFHDIGYYDRILNHIATQRTTWSLPEIERWAYLSDLDQL